jgi:hypothetical protein
MPRAGSVEPRGVHGRKAHNAPQREDATRKQTASFSPLQGEASWVGCLACKGAWCAMNEMGSVAVDVPVAMRDPASVCVIDAQRAHDGNVRPWEQIEVWN